MQELDRKQEELQQFMNEHETQLKRMQERIQTLATENECYQQQTADHTRVRLDLQTRLDDATIQLHSARTQISSLMSELQQMNNIRTVAQSVCA